MTESLSKHYAILELYPNVAIIKEDVAYDTDGNIVEYASDAVDSLINGRQYSYNRQAEYPSIEDQLDMQYWDAVNGTTTWKDAIAQVKADNPKPQE